MTHFNPFHHMSSHGDMGVCTPDSVTLEMDKPPFCRGKGSLQGPNHFHKLVREGERVEFTDKFAAPISQLSPGEYW